MDGMLLNLLAAAAVLLLFWKAQPIREKGCTNPDYLSREQTKMLKGLLAVVILFHHVAQEAYRGILFLQFQRVGGLAVSLFFFFTGYGLQVSHMSNPGYRQSYLRRRIPSVLVPYLLATLIYWAVYAAFGKVYTPMQILEYTKNGYPIVGKSWFVINILFFYCGFYLIMLLCGRHYGWMIPAAGIYFLLWILFCIRMEYSSYWYATSHLLIFGMAWAVWEKPILDWVSRRRMAATAAVWVCFAVLFLLARLDLPQWLGLSVSGIMYLFFTAGILLLLQKIRIGNPILGFLGSISFEIYLFHAMFLDLSWDTDFHFATNFGWCVFILAGSVITAWITHRLFGRILKALSV